MIRYLAGGLLIIVGLFETSSLRGAAAPDLPRVAVRPWAAGFVAPVALLPFPDGSGRRVILDQVGIAHLASKEGQVAPTPFLDLRSRMVKLNSGFDERGLLGMVFHPKFAENRKLYVYYSAPRRTSAPAEWDHTSHVSEFTVSESNRSVVDPASEQVRLEIDEPYFNHNGGCLLFGQDGYLYISTGDGGNANDQGRREPMGNGQDLMSILGKILRIDVDHGAPYAIPKDNPFPDGTEGRPEIYAWGLRNPWRMSFDRGGTGELFAADVGQGLFEEVDIIVKGGNYGWSLREGRHGFDPVKPNQVPALTPKVGPRGEPLLDPIIEYKNLSQFRNDPEAFGISVTGGHVYRGRSIPGLVGHYVFGDWSRSWGKAEGVLLVASRPSTGEGTWTLQRMTPTTHPEGHLGAYLLAFGMDEAGELYLLTSGGTTPTGRTGRVWKLEPS